MEKKISFMAGELELEGLLDLRSERIGAVVTHPHPLYGGDMSNPVVEALVRSFARKGITTLRFNFRGAGGSAGTHEGGLPEGDDVLAAVRFLADKGITTIHLAGYSFGSWVLAHMPKPPVEVVTMVFVSPPLALMPFNGQRLLPELKLVITGEEDEIAPAGLIQQHIGTWACDARFEIIDYADHFFYGSLDELEQIMHEYLSA